jgi:pSer/pThr/pTyr-binding forkhead associated (FHA) protein
MTVCPSCGKENQDLYKFCLGCGSDLSKSPHTDGKMADAPRAHIEPETAVPVRPHAAEDSTEAAQATAAAQAASEPFNPTESTNVLWAGGSDESPTVEPKPQDATPPPSAARICPSCGGVVPPSFTFCASCGARVDGPPGVTRPAPRAVASAASPRGRLVLVRPDGTEGGSHPLVEGDNIIGRGAGSLFEADGYLSPRHASLVLNAAGLVVRDAGSLNGVFVKVVDEEEIGDGDVFRIGQELLRFDAIPPPEPLADGTEVLGSPNPGFWGRLAVVVGRDQDGSAWPLYGDAIILGRERGDILFPEDGYVSGAHARLSYRDGRFFLADLTSSNGTFVRVRGDRVVPPGSFLLMGQQLFRVVV